MSSKDQFVELDVISVTPEEAARITRIPEHTIRQAMNDRTLPHYEINRKVKVIPVDRLRAWAESYLVGQELSARSPAPAPAPVHPSVQSKMLGRMKTAPGTRRKRAR